MSPPLVAARMLRASTAVAIGGALASVLACAPALRPLSPAHLPRVAAAERTDSTTTQRAKSRVPAKTSSKTSASAVARTSAHVHGPDVTFDVDIHQYENDERVARYVALFSGSARESFAEQLERGTRYESMIRGRLRAAALPGDMFYLALVESGFDPQATSRASAVGMWQFVAGTAREIGLRVDWWVDERRDPVRATDAAARNLRWLRTQFGSTFLAAAAYNGGETRVTRGLAHLADSLRADSVRADSAALESGALSGALGTTVADVDGDATRVVPAVAVRATVATPDDARATAPADGDARYFALASAGLLRPETRNYVPQIIAAMLVGKEPARYGITLHPQPALSFDSVRVAPLTPLAAVAQAADATREQVLDLNPHLLRGVTPPGAATLVRVPVGRGAATAEALDGMSATERRAFRRVATHKHETLDAIAVREEVPLRVLQRYNPGLETVRSKGKTYLAAGQGVRVPTRAMLAYARDVPDYDAAPLAGLPTLPRVAVDTTATSSDAKKAPSKSKVPNAAKSHAAKSHAAKSHETKPSAKKNVAKKAKRHEA